MSLNKDLKGKHCKIKKMSFDRLFLQNMSCPLKRLLRRCCLQIKSTFDQIIESLLLTLTLIVKWTVNWRNVSSFVLANWVFYPLWLR